MVSLTILDSPCFSVGNEMALPVLSFLRDAVTRFVFWLNIITGASMSLSWYFVLDFLPYNVILLSGTSITNESSA